jgi:hypothetical protein
MLLRLTHNLAKKVKARPVEHHPMHANAFADWSAHYLPAQDEPVLLIMNTRSLYTVIAPGDGLVNPVSFEARVFAYVKDALMSDGFEFFYRRLVDGDDEATVFSKPLDEASKAALDDVGELVLHYLSEEGLEREACAAKINEAPMSVLKQETPKRAFQTMGF